MHTPKSTPLAAERDAIEISYSPVMRVGASALFAWFTGWMLFWVCLALFSGHVLLIFVGSVAVIFVGPLLLPLLPAVLFNRARLLSDWNVSLRLLSCSRHGVLKEARRLHQRNLRRHVVELNKRRSADHPHGWTGTL